MNASVKVSIFLLSLFVCGSLLALDAGAGSPEAPDFQAWKGKPEEKFTGGAAAFEQARKLLLERYVDQTLTEEDLWRAAVEGMLRGAGGRKWDTLISPAEAAEMMSTMSGEVVGIGVEIKFDAETGWAGVRRTMKGSAAEKAGLLAGDTILKVDGKAFKGKEYRDLVYAIRGKEGASVELTLLRDTKVFVKSLRRERVAIQTVTDVVLPGDVGLVTVTSFGEKTPAALRESLERLRARKVRGLVVDLRGNAGGLFDKVITSAEALVPKGSTVVSTISRGGAKEALVSKGEPVLGSLPIAVLVNENTSSGAELLAAALRDVVGARVVGKKTLGKWNVQSVEELSNGFAVKFTIAIFESPKGERLDGEGLIPDLEVEADGSTLDRVREIADAKERLAADAQLRTAVAALR